MFGWIRRLFGSGKAKFKIETESGKIATGQASFEGCFDEILFIEQIVPEFEFKHNERVKQIKITGIIGQTGVSDNPYSGRWYARKS